MKNTTLITIYSAGYTLAISKDLLTNPAKYYKPGTDYYNRIMQLKERIDNGFFYGGTDKNSNK